MRERVRKVELLSLAWKAKVIPIYDTRIILLHRYCRGAEIRTLTKRSQSVRATVTQHPDIKIYIIFLSLSQKANQKPPSGGF